ncbi:hypothetical protein LOZ58_003749 [Ophidiomyces ophidiicola]|nr:hypothetical protein LOZ65_000568 [Ophidiomyces ophidiicola]KAI1942031.1 hypothetical protein LOZ66_001512 [Ophidiomyces ophidiicola]KAI1960676.1 hypothetical protein LOZ58_003749 [Ophidiomyces ophidiicola]
MAAPQNYAPRSLPDSIQNLGLAQVVKDFMNFPKKPDTKTACTAMCNALRHSMPSEVAFPGSESYTTNKASYWAKQQSEISPTCFLAVKTTRSIAVALILSQVSGCPFIIRAGGTSDVPGASNTALGVTIDLRAFNKVTLSTDKKIATVDSGAFWGDVYKELDPQQVTVAGGRASTVGVGGLSLGGGVSYIAGRAGFTCDTVLKYTIMMADGQILEVDQHSHPLLYFALRGGGNNFGVVLKFDFETYPVAQMWGGFRSYVAADTKNIISRGLSSYNANPMGNEDFALITTYAARNGTFFSTVGLSNAKPEADPPIYKSNFPELLKMKPLVDSTRTTTTKGMTDELARRLPPGLRNQFTTITFKNDAELQNKLVDIYMEEATKLKPQLSTEAGFLPAIVIQPIPTTITSKLKKRGGNALGLSESDGPLILVNISFQWSAVVDDKVVLPAVQRILERTKAWAQARGLTHRYIYLNYAAPLQKPITSYGPENVKKLRQAQMKYDPLKVFELHQPGGFKLNM